MVLLKGVDRGGFVWSVMFFYYNGNAAIKSVFGQMFSSPMLQSFLNAGAPIMKVERHVNYVKILTHLFFSTGMVEIGRYQYFSD